jgi:hypothetical protein
MMEFDNNYSALEKWKLINDVFTPEDVFVIDGFKRVFRYGPDNTIDCRCTKCGEERKISFRFSLLEFFPTDSDLGDIRTRILLTKPSKNAAKRAEEPSVPKTLMVAEAAPSGVRKPVQGKGTARGADGSDEAKTVQPIITPEMSSKMAAKVLEEARHEVSLEIEPGPQPFTSIVGRK